MRKRKRDTSQLVLKQLATFEDDRRRIPDSVLCALHGLLLFAWTMACLAWVNEMLDLQVGLFQIALAVAIFCFVLEIGVGLNCLWRLSVGACLVVLSYIGLNRHQMAEGLDEIVYRATERISQYYRIDSGMGGVSVDEKMVMPVLLALAGILVLAVGISTVKWQMGTVPQAVSLILLLCALSIDALPSVGIVVVLMIAVVGLTVLSSSEISIYDGTAERQIFIKSGLYGIGITLVVIVISYIAAQGFVMTKMNSYYDAVKEYPQRMIAAGQAFLSGENGTRSPIEKLQDMVSSDFLDVSGKLTNQAPVQTGNIVLEVSMNRKPKEPLYFRNYVGTSYDDGQWAAVKDESLRNNYKTWGVSDKWTYEEARNMLAMQLYHSLAKADLTGNCLYEVVNRAASDSLTWVPYGIDTSDLTPEADGVFGSSQIELFMGYPMMDSSELIEMSDDWWIDGEQRMLFEAYSAYVYDTYLEVPDNMLALSAAYEQLYQTYGDGSVSEWIALIQNELDSSCTYQKYGLDSTPWGTDLVDDFYGRQQKGYCIHFASAGVMLLRMAGIPARYVAGYVAWPDDFSYDSADGSYHTEVTGYRGHAWVEVYDTEAGAWLPVEMTPASEAGITGDQTESMDEDGESETKDRQSVVEDTESTTATERETKDLESELVPASENNEESDRTKPTGSGNTDGISEEDAQQDSQSGIGSWMVLIAGMIVTLIVLVVLFIFVKRSSRQKHRRRQDDKNKALLSMEWHLTEMMEKAGWCPENGASDWDYAAWVQGKVDTLEEDEYLYFMEKLHQAAYSEEMITEEEYKKCKATYRKIIDKLRQKK